jgi:hypothetical protein
MLLRAPARSLASRSRSSSTARAQHLERLRLVLVLALLVLLDDHQSRGRWVIRTAESVVLTDWPPGPDER